MTRRILVFLAACALSLACAGPAQADLLAEIGKDYTQDGKLDPCKYTEKQLRDLKAAIPNDFEQYSDFGAVVDDALAKRAQGACNKAGATPNTTAPPAATGTAPPPPGATGTPAPGTATPAPTAAAPPPTPGPGPTAAPDVAAR